MNLSENVNKLQTLLPALKASDAQFAANLIFSFKKYGGLTPKQEPWIEKLIARAETPAFQVIASFPAKPEAVNVGGFAGVLHLFAEAKAHLKFPKIRLQVDGKKVILALNGEKSKKPGHVTLKSEGSYPNYTFYGSVSPEGQFTPANATYGAFGEALTKLLTDLAANPARVAKEYGKLTGNCCFCGKDIGTGKEQRSVLVGFGPDCAEHYGLKGEWLAAAEKAEAKASVAAPKLSVQDEVIESFVAQQQEAVAVSKAKLEAEAQHEAAYEAKLKALSDYVVKPVAEVLLAAESAQAKNDNAKPEWVQALQKMPSMMTITPKAQKAIDTLAEAIGTVGEQAAKAVKNFEIVTADAYQIGSIEWKDTGGNSVEPVVTHTCFFCEQAVEAVKILHGYHVCFACVEQLKG